MKKIYSIIGIALLGVVAFLISCERDNEAILTTLSVTNEDYKMSYTSAIITCHISSEATLGNVYLHYSARQDFEEYDAIDVFEPEEAYDVIRSKQIVLKPQSVDEAILQMNLLDHQFYMFLNSANEKICVVYARKDGGYGLIIPDID